MEGKIIQDIPHSNGSTATLIFFRPDKLAGSTPEIIVGTVHPDEVIARVRNGSWCRIAYTHFGAREFVTGVYTANPERFNIMIEPGETYYVRCTLQIRGLTITSTLELVNEPLACQEMAELKHQIGSRRI